jgi:hypothetical protein
MTKTSLYEINRNEQYVSAFWFSQWCGEHNNTLSPTLYYENILGATRPQDTITML